MNYIGIISIDSYHLNGQHCPTIWTTGIWSDNFKSECIDKLARECNRRGLKDDEGNDITKIQLIPMFNKELGDTLHVQYLREGYIKVCIG